MESTEPLEGLYNPIPSGWLVDARVIRATLRRLDRVEGLDLTAAVRTARGGIEMAFGIRSKQPRVAIDEALDGSPGGASGTYLDPGSVLSGELRFAGNVRLEGRVEGEIHAGQTVIVGEHASIDASIVADTLEVYGTVVGDIRVARRTLLHKSARVEGEIRTAGIVIEEGAHFKGCILIGHEEPRLPSIGGASDVPSLAAVRAEPRHGRQDES